MPMPIKLGTAGEPGYVVPSLSERENLPCRLSIQFISIRSEKKRTEEDGGDIRGITQEMVPSGNDCLLEDWPKQSESVAENICGEVAETRIRRGERVKRTQNDRSS
jgi:hypothetical protein